jgi:hypothetical protein
MSERLYGTIKKGETVIFTNVGLVLSGTNVAKGHETNGGSFFVPRGKRVKIGERFQLYRPDGRWAEIEICDLDEKIDLTRFVLLGGWQREQGLEEKPR